MTKRLLVLLVLSLLAASPAYAQRHAGVRVGVSGEPAQVFFGGHVETSPVIEHLTFRPNAEVGVGDDTTLIALNFEFAYWIPIERKPWRVYFGAGPAANIYSSGDDGRGRGDSGVTGGFNILIGAQHTKGLFTELKVGAIDSPTIKFTVGYAFK